MRPALVAIISALAIAPRDGAAQLSSVACNSCVAKVVAVLPTSVDFAASFGTAVPNAATSECSIRYRLVGSTYNKKRMVKAGSSFTISIVALPPSRPLDFRMVCDGAAGPLFTVTTLAAASPPPKRPTIVSATRVGETVHFEFTSDSSEPTVYWPEFRFGAGPWTTPFDELEGTFTSKKIGASAPLATVTAIRLVVRNSGGIVHSAAVP